MQTARAGASPCPIRSIADCELIADVRRLFEFVDGGNLPVRSPGAITAAGDKKVQSSSLWFHNNYYANWSSQEPLYGLIAFVDDGIWIVSFMSYDLGFIDLEQKTLQPLDNPFGPRLSPMS